mgnify:CR=1 FL=1
MGQSVPRTEDPRLLRGGGRYVDDIRLPNECHAYMLRTPHAHARIVSIETKQAQRMPGVIAVYTGADWVGDGHGQHPAGHNRVRRDGSPLYDATRNAIAHEAVKVTGDIVAMIVAESVNLGKDAAEKIIVEYDLMPVITEGTQARAEGAPVLHEGCEDNEGYFYTAGDKQAVCLLYTSDAADE